QDAEKLALAVRPQEMIVRGPVEQVLAVRHVEGVGELRARYAEDRPGRPQRQQADDHRPPLHAALEEPADFGEALLAIQLLERLAEEAGLRDEVLGHLAV